jgi:peptidoglycan lytic transglycosylase
VGRRGDGRADEGAGVTRLSTLTVVALVLAGLGLYVVKEKPEVYERVRYPLRYEEIVTGHARNYHLEPHLVAAVIYQESKFDADAVSSSGAVGLMQLLPATAQGIADRTGGTGWHERDLLDPELNIRYGAWYLRHLLDKYEDEELALAAYNAGQTNVDRWRARGDGIVFLETRHYVERVRELKAIYARAYASELGLS